MWIDTIWYYHEYSLMPYTSYKNGDICGTENILCEFIWNSGKVELFLCYTTYIIIWYYIHKRHSDNYWFNNQRLIQYL